jgi:hypothetical protein
MQFDPNAKFDINCPNGHTVSVTLGEMRQSALVTCPTCRATIQLEGDQFDRQMREAEKSVEDFGKRLTRRFGR